MKKSRPTSRQMNEGSGERVTVGEVRLMCDDLHKIEAEYINKLQTQIHYLELETAFLRRRQDKNESPYRALTACSDRTEYRHTRTSTTQHPIKLVDKSPQHGLKESEHKAYKQKFNKESGAESNKWENQYANNQSDRRQNHEFRQREIQHDRYKNRKTNRQYQQQSSEESDSQYYKQWNSKSDKLYIQEQTRPVNNQYNKEQDEQRDQLNSEYKANHGDMQKYRESPKEADLQVYKGKDLHNSAPQPKPGSRSGSNKQFDICSDRCDNHQHSNENYSEKRKKRDYKAADYIFDSRSNSERSENHLSSDNNYDDGEYNSVEISMHGDEDENGINDNGSDTNDSGSRTPVPFSPHSSESGSLGLHTPRNYSPNANGHILQRNYDSAQNLPNDNHDANLKESDTGKRNIVKLNSASPATFVKYSPVTAGVVGFESPAIAGRYSATDKGAVPPLENENRFLAGQSKATRGPTFENYTAHIELNSISNVTSRLLSASGPCSVAGLTYGGQQEQISHGQNDDHLLELEVSRDFDARTPSRESYHSSRWSYASGSRGSPFDIRYLNDDQSIKSERSARSFSSRADVRYINDKRIESDKSGIYGVGHGCQVDVRLIKDDQSVKSDTSLHSMSSRTQVDGVLLPSGRNINVTKTSASIPARENVVGTTNIDNFAETHDRERVSNGVGHRSSVQSNHSDINSISSQESGHLSDGGDISKYSESNIPLEFRNRPSGSQSSIKSKGTSTKSKGFYIEDERQSDSIQNISDIPLERQQISSQAFVEVTMKGDSNFDSKAAFRGSEDKMAKSDKYPESYEEVEPRLNNRSNESISESLIRRDQGNLSASNSGSSSSSIKERGALNPSDMISQKDEQDTKLWYGEDRCSSPSMKDQGVQSARSSQSISATGNREKAPWNLSGMVVQKHGEVTSPSLGIKERATLNSLGMVELKEVTTPSSKSDDWKNAEDAELSRLLREENIQSSFDRDESGRRIPQAKLQRTVNVTQIPSQSARSGSDKIELKSSSSQSSKITISPQSSRSSCERIELECSLVQSQVSAQIWNQNLPKSVKSPSAISESESRKSQNVASPQNLNQNAPRSVKPASATEESESRRPQSAASVQNMDRNQSSLQSAESEGDGRESSSESVQNVDASSSQHLSRLSQHSDADIAVKPVKPNDIISPRFSENHQPSRRYEENLISIAAGEFSQGDIVERESIATPSSELTGVESGNRESLKTSYSTERHVSSTDRHASLPTTEQKTVEGGVLARNTSQNQEEGMQIVDVNGEDIKDVTDISELRYVALEQKKLAQMQMKQKQLQNRPQQLQKQTSAEQLQQQLEYRRQLQRQQWEQQQKRGHLCLQPQLENIENTAVGQAVSGIYSETTNAEITTDTNNISVTANAITATLVSPSGTAAYADVPISSTTAFTSANDIVAASNPIIAAAEFPSANSLAVFSTGTTTAQSLSSNSPSAVRNSMSCSSSSGGAILTLTNASEASAVAPNSLNISTSSFIPTQPVISTPATTATTDTVSSTKVNSAQVTSSISSISISNSAIAAPTIFDVGRVEEMWQQQMMLVQQNNELAERLESLVMTQKNIEKDKARLEEELRRLNETQKRVVVDNTELRATNIQLTDQINHLQEQLQQLQTLREQLSGLGVERWEELSQLIDSLKSFSRSILAEQPKQQ